MAPLLPLPLLVLPHLVPLAVLLLLLVLLVVVEEQVQLLVLVLLVGALCVLGWELRPLQQEVPRVAVVGVVVVAPAAILASVVVRRIRARRVEAG